MKAASCLALVLAACAAPALADDRSSGFWGGADVGYGSVRRTFETTPSDTKGNFALAFRGGYFWRRDLLLGIEVGGWSYQSSNTSDPSQGEGISALLAFAQYYPIADSPLFVKAGLGAADYWNHRPHESNARSGGPAGMIGAGRDFRLGSGSSFYLTPALDYSWGRVHDATTPPDVTQDFRYRALTLRIGVTYR